MTGKANPMQAGIPAWASALIALFGSGSLITGLGLMWKNHRDSKLAEKKDDRDARKDDVEVFTDWMAASVQSAAEAAAARQDAREARDELSALQRQMEGVLARERERDDRITHLETDTSHIVGFLVIVKQGIADGTIPPWPEETPVVRSYMARIETTTITQQEQP